MKHRSTLARTGVALIAAALGLPLHAADKKPAAPKAEGHEAASKIPAYLTPETATPDFKLQGEYSGDVSGGGKLGAQVVSLGGGAFEAVFLPGGLPGDGYDGNHRIVVPGKSEGADAAAFADPKGGGYSATVTGGALKGRSADGKTFELKRVERKSPAEGAKPPEGATVLFDGTNADAWKDGKVDDRHLLMIGAETKKAYQNFTLHVEFLLPFKPLGRDQDRGNSGIYIQKRYEVQVLDTFGHEPEFNGIGSMYRQHAPSVNMCYPPLQWQTYDIDFQAPKFDADGKKTQNAVITVKLNGVVVQDKYEITAKTGAGSPEGPNPGPILLQAHNNPVFYRNIWIVEK